MTNWTASHLSYLSVKKSEENKSICGKRMRRYCTNGMRFSTNLWKTASWWELANRQNEGRITLGYIIVEKDCRSWHQFARQNPKGWAYPYAHTTILPHTHTFTHTTFQRMSFFWDYKPTPNFLCFMFSFFVPGLFLIITSQCWVFYFNSFLSEI